MKTKLTLMGIAASLAAAVSVNAQSAFTGAVGFHTEDLVPGFNMIGVNVGNGVAAAGDFEAAGNDVDALFTGLDSPAKTYTVQNITTGEYAPVDSVTDDTNIVTTLGVTAGDRYEIRQDQTIEDIFGAANEAGLLAGTAADADIIWVPKGDGTYDRIYRNTETVVFPALTPGWRFVGNTSDTNAATHIVPFQFGMFIQVRGPALSLTFVGHVRGEDDVDDGHGAPTTVIPVATGFNAINRIVPVEIALSDSGVALTPGTAATGDVLWNPKGDGTYNRIYNNTETVVFPALTPGLRYVGNTSDDDASGELLQSGFLVQDRNALGTLGVSVPASLDL